MLANASLPLQATSHLNWNHATPSKSWVPEKEKLPRWVLAIWPAKQQAQDPGQFFHKTTTYSRSHCCCLSWYPSSFKQGFLLPGSCSHRHLTIVAWPSQVSSCSRHKPGSGEWKIRLLLTWLPPLCIPVPSGTCQMPPVSCTESSWSYPHEALLTDSHTLPHFWSWEAATCCPSTSPLLSSQI